MEDINYLKFILSCTSGTRFCCLQSGAIFDTDTGHSGKASGKRFGVYCLLNECIYFRVILPCRLNKIRLYLWCILQSTAYQYELL